MGTKGGAREPGRGDREPGRSARSFRISGTKFRRNLSFSGRHLCPFFGDIGHLSRIKNFNPSFIPMLSQASAISLERESFYSILVATHVIFTHIYGFLLFVT